MDIITKTARWIGGYFHEEDHEAHIKMHSELISNLIGEPIPYVRSMIQHSINELKKENLI
ncbi:MAG TPA: hypothetical protein ENH82_19425 [bacterium]|nr:hypothetical protein [bacterium]